MISYHLLPFDKTAPTSIVSWFFKVQGGEGIRMPAGFSMIFLVGYDVITVLTPKLFIM